MACCHMALVLLLAHLVLRSEEAFNSTDLDDEESDSVPYMIIIEDAEGRRCAGALVSQRTALSSARCVRRGNPPTALWALAAALVADRGAVRAADGARRVVRVAVAGTDATDPSNDLALLTINEPFGEKAQARAIRMATAAGECDAAPECNTVRALSQSKASGAPNLRLRVISVHRAPHAVCSAHVPHWAVVKERSLCLQGENLCKEDLGGGVVCAGLLCGVLTLLGRGSAEDEACVNTFAALTVARWRRFLHCAHTQRLCGRGDCASLCTEHWLDGSDDTSAAASLSSVPQTVVVVEEADRAITAQGVSFLAYNKNKENASQLSSMPGHDGRSTGSSRNKSSGTTKTSTGRGPGRAVAAIAPLRQASRTPLVYELRLSADFDPNRADFRRSRVSLSTLAGSSMRLKAGEYGDNALDYGAPPDEALASSPAVATSPRSRPLPLATPPFVATFRIEADPPAQPQTNVNKKKSKTSNGGCAHYIKAVLLIALPTLAAVTR